MPVSLEAMLQEQSPEIREQIERDALAIVAESRTLAQLRKDAGLTQEQVAEALETTQANLAQIERKDDVLVSTVSRVVQAMGGRLRLMADLPGRGLVEVNLSPGAVNLLGKKALKRNPAHPVTVQENGLWVVKSMAGRTVGGPFRTQKEAATLARELAAASDTVRARGKEVRPTKKGPGESGPLEPRTTSTTTSTSTPSKRTTA